MLTRAACLVSCVVVVTLVACSGSSSSSGSGGDTEAACTDIASSLCKKLDECAPVAISITYGDLETCKTRERVRCNGALNAPSTGLTSSAATACAADIGKGGCDTVFVKLPTSCDSPEGALADGTPCGVDEQCKGKRCRKANGSACGACSSLAPAGGSCEVNGDCALQNECAGGKCVIPAKAGGACSETQPCEGLLRCANKVCAVPLGAGAACTAGAVDDACDRLKGLYCDAASKVCKSIGLAKAGEACGSVNGTQVTCVAGGRCKITGVTGTGTCEAGAKDGEKCSDETVPSCLAPARCVGGVCTITDPASCR